MISNVNVYGLEESLKASGYPMSVELDDIEADLTRGEKLGNAKQGSGHDCYLKGIIVQMDVAFPQYIWQQAKRYHWFDFVSSQSTMHRITKMNIREQCNEYVFPETINLLNVTVDIYNNYDRYVERFGADRVRPKDELFHVIISNIPSGFLLTARITTNYLQLKTMYNQRKHHKMREWKEFCAWIETLPNFNDLCLRRAA